MSASTVLHRLAPAAAAPAAPVAGQAARLAGPPSADYAAKLDRTIVFLHEHSDAHPDLIQLSSLGAEDMVLTDLIARTGLPVEVATLDTGHLHEQTLALLDRIAQHHGIKVAVFRPQAQAVVDFVRTHGPQAMYTSVALRKACCRLRKLEPLARALHGRSAWLTGLRSEQSGQRASMRPVEADVLDPQAQRLKLNPLHDWTWGDVWHYLMVHAVPYNPLHDAFHSSIGCAPCTRAISPGEDFRAGRWWWEQDNARECGLHVRPA